MLHKVVLWLSNKLQFSVIPLRPLDKTPLLASWKPYQDRRSTEEELASWFPPSTNGKPENNIGIVTGTVSGIVVVDADSEEGEAWARERLPETPFVVRTAKGFHRYYRHPGEGKIIHGKVRVRVNGCTLEIDIRGDGGYVVGPGSIHPSGDEYKATNPENWTPEGLARLPVFDPAWFPEEHDQEEKPERRDITQDVPELPPDEKIRQARAYLSKVPGVPEGERNATAFRVACILVNDFALGDNPEAWEFLQEWNRKNSPPLDENELHTIFESALKTAQGSPGTKLMKPSKKEEAEDKEFLQTAPSWPDPPDEAAFYGLAGDLVRAIDPHTEADPVAVLVQFLAAFGNVIGRSPYFMAEADEHFTNLFVVLIGVSAKGRKGVSRRQALQICEKVDPEWVKNCVDTAALSTGEGLIWAVRDPISKKDQVEDQGVPDKRLLCIQEEFAFPLKTMAREGNTFSSVLRMAWDSGDLQIKTKSSPAKATGAHISIIGHITHNELRKYLTETECGNGFANRILWLCVRRSKCLPRGGKIREAIFSPLEARLQKAVSFAREVKEIAPDEGTWAVWEKVYPELSEGKPGLLGAIISRGEAQVMRLASIYALLDSSSAIRKEHLLAALALWEYCEASARFVFGDALGDPVADRILQALKAAPSGLTRTEIRDLLGRNRSAEQIGSALSLLREQGLARGGTEKKMGVRPEERWFAT